MRSLIIAAAALALIATDALAQGRPDHAGQGGDRFLELTVAADQCFTVTIPEGTHLVPVGGPGRGFIAPEMLEVTNSPGSAEVCSPVDGRVRYHTPQLDEDEEEDEEEEIGAQ